MQELQRKSVVEFKAAVKLPIVIVLDNVRSMNNVGSIFRTADAFLVESIYLCGHTPTPPHRDIQKTALGATETVHWEYDTSTENVVQALLRRAYDVLAVEQVKESVYLNQLPIDIERPTALVFGNEVDGVSQAVIELCQGCVEIPQMGVKHSLNIAVSAGIVLWEYARKNNFSKNNQ
jgi:23S rRNA (guanosine2251-2'-O)-methyltransferase